MANQPRVKMRPIDAIVSPMRATVVLCKPAGSMGFLPGAALEVTLMSNVVQITRNNTEEPETNFAKGEVSLETTEAGTVAGYQS
jgi:hypothetical protein